MPGSALNPAPAFSIGITGHRPNRLPERGRAAVEGEIGRLLTLMVTLGHARSPRVAWRVVSGLAEGADRIAAEAALARGIALYAILPFEAREYEKDFQSPQSKTRFRELLAKAKQVEALPGDRAQPDVAYEAAGLAMLRAADVLVAVWDGGPSGGRGGTTEMVKAAVARSVPVLWVDPAGTRPAKPYDDPSKSCEDTIAAALTRKHGGPT